MEHYYLCPSDHLAHHGIKEQQWGVRRGPPYPLARTSNGRLDTKAQAAAKRRSTQVGGLGHLTLNGKRITKEDLSSAWASKKQARAEIRQKRKEEKEAAKALKEKKAAEKKAEKEAAEEARKKLIEEQVKSAEANKREALKQYIRHHPTEFPKYVDVFTREEVNEIASRIELDKKVRQIRNDEIYHYMEYFNKAAEALKATNTTIQNGIGVYNSVASVWNTIGEEAQKKKDLNKAFEEQKKTDPKAKQDDRFRPLPRVGGDNKEADQKKKNDKGDKTDKPQDQPKNDNAGNQKNNSQQPKNDSTGNQKSNSQQPKTDTSTQTTASNENKGQTKRSYSGVEQGSVSKYMEQFGKTLDAYSRATPKERKKFENSWKDIVKNMDSSELDKPLSSITDEKVIKAKAVTSVLDWFAENEQKK